MNPFEGVPLGTPQEIHDLRPDQCLIRLEGDVVVCLRSDDSRHRHDPKAPIGATRANLIAALEAAKKRERQ